MLITGDMKEDLPSIDPAALEAVTGGTSTGTSSQVTLMLQQLMSSIQDLASNQGNNSTNQFMQMLPILMMMNRRQEPPPPPAPVAPPPGDGWIRVA